MFRTAITRTLLSRSAALAATRAPAAPSILTTARVSNPAISLATPKRNYHEKDKYYAPLLNVMSYLLLTCISCTARSLFSTSQCWLYVQE